MGMTRATKEKRLAELDQRLERGRKTAARYRELAEATTARVRVWEAELEWLAQAPVVDPPLPGTETP